LSVKEVVVKAEKELLHDPTPEALESLTVLLTVVGPSFDTPEWTLHPAFVKVFERVAVIAHQMPCKPRIQCLLRDVVAD